MALLPAGPGTGEAVTKRMTVPGQLGRLVLSYFKVNLGEGHEKRLEW